MTELPNDAPIPVFKRRKIAHPRVRHDTLTDSTTESPDAAVTRDAQHPAANLQRIPIDDPDESGVNLQQILRNRKRPRDRAAEAARKAAQSSPNTMTLIPRATSEEETPQTHQYLGRFVAQTGQVVAQDQKAINEYVEARIASENHRHYGWVIPKRLEHIVARLNLLQPDSPPVTANHVSTTRVAAGDNDERRNSDHDVRLAAGMGKLQEVDLGPEATTRNIQRTEEAWRRIQDGQPAAPVVEEASRRKRRPRRGEKVKTAEDIARDKMVEQVLREAKRASLFPIDPPYITLILTLPVEFFEEAPAPPPTMHENSGDNDTNDATMAEAFRREYLESQESRNQRKPAPPPGVKGVKEQPKGPKLGGSRSARAAMRLQEEAAAKKR
ncbi:hypothetical protein P154DRAFT_528451 [Amniculicola lignicola CBS 123094]|uniref:Hepatocellular carcinoma-associated antigen 59-domain-containing protein n=1 Tax=Amniculicola lignicola CBS 123094 TaxID=1392246 RepID=A0A6A5X4B2_9PLEO|nr:hypothetical protein P154DRAFT_528451 [Amniculicola lignicola CBS 123094]